MGLALVGRACSVRIGVNLQHAVAGFSAEKRQYAVERIGNVKLAAVGLARLNAFLVVGEGQAGFCVQPAKQRQAVAVHAVGVFGNLLAQAGQLLHQGVALHLVVHAAAGIDHQGAEGLQGIHGFAQRRFAVFDRGFLRIQPALVTGNALQAVAGALGLGGGHGVVAGTNHAHAGRGVLHLAGQLVLLAVDVVDGAVVHIGRTQAGNRHGKDSLT